jgi:actin-like ATPase involved in cell morphogenesis
MDSPPSAHSSPREKACVPASKVARNELRRSWCSVVGEARGVVVAEEAVDESLGMVMNVMVAGWCKCVGCGEGASEEGLYISLLRVVEE